MAVFRVERTQNYTVMSNYHLRDRRLSLKAKGLLSLMLSLPEDWDYTLSGLSRISLEGKDAIRAAVVELERAGYVQRRQTTDKAGKFSSNEYIIRERPTPQELPPKGPSAADPSSENPTTGKPSAAFTSPEKPTQIKKDSEKTDIENTKLPSIESFPFCSAPPALEAKGRDARPRRGRSMDEHEMAIYRGMIRENIRYDDFAREYPWDVDRLDEMVELMVETVCSNRENVRVCGNDLPQAVVKSRLLKLDGSHIRYVFECLKDNTTHIRNIRQYLLTALYNAPATMENYYAAQVNYDLYGVAA